MQFVVGRRDLLKTREWPVGSVIAQACHACTAATVAHLDDAHVRAACAACRANLYVLALEDSCPYWMNRGFVLEEGANLRARLNIFPDTHLLRRAVTADVLEAVEAAGFEVYRVGRRARRHGRQASQLPV